MKKSHKKSLLIPRLNSVRARIVVSGMVLTMIGIASYGSYQHFSNMPVERIQANSVQPRTPEPTNTSKKLEDIEKKNEPIGNKTDTPIVPKAEASIEEQQVAPSEHQAPGPTTGGGCAGIACYSLGGFSITASPKTVMLRANESAPVLIRTTDGSKVDWGGMPEAGGLRGVGSFAHSFPGRSSSFEYYVSAHEEAKPGVYRLEFYATKDAAKQWAKTTVVVTVTP